MRIPLDRNSPVPLYQQIHRFLREEIRSGRLPTETRLPSSRSLAGSLGLSRITVTSAYAELEAEGLVVEKLGSGTYVARPLLPLPEPSDRDSATRDWPLWQTELPARDSLALPLKLDRPLGAGRPSGLISFAGDLGATDLFPVRHFRKALQTTLGGTGLQALGYGEPAGYPPLRTTVAQILTNQGIPARPDEVLITTGSQQAIALIAGLLLRPGDAVLVERPTYTGVLDLLRALQVRVYEAPVDEQGMQVAKVEEIIATARLSLIYTNPTYHNPTGTCMSGDRRRQLIGLADHHNVPVLEDDFAGDLRYEGRAQPALKALDPGGRVIHVRTFSKMLMPGLRLGFLVASGPVYERLLAAKRVTDLTTSSLMQRALESYITVGRYQAHLRQACQVHRRRRDAMLRALRRYLPGARCLPPRGGLFAWLELPPGILAEELYPVAVEEGVDFVPGSLYFPEDLPQPYLRLNFAMHPPEVAEEGVRRLANAVERFLARRRGG